MEGAADRHEQQTHVLDVHRRAIAFGQAREKWHVDFSLSLG
uniref:Uncharacterized protein n=1 Tax=Mycetohabitans sp. TaxID=2571162 RepID=A0A6B9HD65_9BURK|nr:hypothetical protein [Mycetohabitans sp.]